MSERVADDAARTPPNDLKPREAPPTPPSPEDVDGTDLKGSRKREREVSLEPATPKPDEPHSATENLRERRTPAPKKNRVQLGTTTEEDETPPASPAKPSMELATSPPHETKVRQISRKVRGMKWDDKSAPELSQDMNASATNPDVELEPAAEIQKASQAASPTQNTTVDDASQTSADSQNEAVAPEAVLTLTRTATMESDSDDPEKRLKRKITDRLPSTSVETPPAKAGAEPSKRPRDDTEVDENPRDKKRPTPPPEEHKAEEDAKDDKPSTAAVEPAAPQPMIGGFLAYASTSSPFAQAKGPSIFGTKSTPSPSPLAGSSNGVASSLSSMFANKSSSPSPFAIAANKPVLPSTSVFASSTAFSSSTSYSTNVNNLSTSPTGTKRSGFEAFASASPFAGAARSKSPSAGFGLARSKSPTRRTPGSSINAFKSYVGSGTQSFAAPSPPIKKLRQDSGDDVEGGKASLRSVLSPNVLNGASSGSEEEGEKPATFSDRLRASKNVDESQEGSEEDEKVVITEQEVQTGEENDDTIFQVRGKLYALSDQKAWKERGTGLLKLNVRKSDGGGARLVMRKEAVFTLLLNVTLFKGMRCTLAQDPRYVRFSCIESGTTVHYNLRLSNAKVSSELIEEINANIPGEVPDVAV